MAEKYSVVLATLKPDGGDVWQHPREVLQTIAEAGYQGVDLDAEPNRIDAQSFCEVVELAQSLGLEIPALVGAWGGWHAGEERDLASPDRTRRDHAVNYAKSCIDLAATLDKPPVFEICAAAFQPEYPISSFAYDDLRQAFVASSHEICDYGAVHGVGIAIEPINRFEDHPGFLNSLAEATDIVKEVGASNLGVLADLFHVNIEDGPMASALRAAGCHLMHVHPADNNRQMPGSGHIDFLELIRTLKSVRFAGYLSLDCIPPRPDWKTQVRSSIDYMRGVERIVDMETGLKV